MPLALHQQQLLRETAAADAPAQRARCVRPQRRPWRGLAAHCCVDVLCGTCAQAPLERSNSVFYIVFRRACIG